MKKIISVLLVIMMLFCTFPISTVSAQDNVLTLGSELICNYTGGTLSYTFTPTEQVTAVLYSKTYDEDTDPSMDIYCNGEYVDSADDEGMGFNFFYCGEFYPGSTYTFEIYEYYGILGSWDIVFREKAIESIEIISTPELYSDVYGNVEMIYEGITVQINYLDPSLPSKTVTFTENTFETEVDGLPLYIEFYPEDSIIKASLEGVTDETEAVINTKAVKSFELSFPESSKILYEDIDCINTAYYDEEKDEYVEGYVYSPSFVNATAIVTYEDDTVQTISYNEDPLFFLMLENDLSSQFKTPWQIGSHSVTFSYQGLSATIIFELMKNPYVSAEITKAPDITESLFEGNGAFAYDSEYNEYFLYDTSLVGIEVVLKSDDGTETVISDKLSVMLKLTVSTDQETDHWGIGDHTVEVYYGKMLIGSYTYTVSAVTLRDIDIITKAEGAFYYTDTGTTSLLEDGLTVKLTLSDGSTKTVDVENFQSSDAGTALFLYEDYDAEKDNYFYAVCNNAYSVTSEAVYYTKLERSVVGVDIITPPAKMTYVYDYGIDIYSLDLSGLTVDIYWSDNSVDTWTYSDTFEDGIGVFNNTIIALTVSSDYMLCYAGNNYCIYYSEDYKSISEYSLGTIAENTEMTVDLGLPQITVYTFTPWDDGEYHFTSDGEGYSIIAIYNESGYIIEDLVATEHILNGSTKAELTFECLEGETYYVLIEKFDLYESDNDTKVDFTVEHTIYGDANGDGRVTISDVLLTRKYLAGIIGEDSIDQSAADVNGDGRITISDVLFIRKYLAGIISEFPKS